MRYAVVSDIHSNLPALEAVIVDAQETGFDALVCLGDIVGYGPNPNECIECLHRFPNTIIAGNHDWGAIGKADLLVFNRDARIALNWTQGELTPDHREILTSLPTTLPLNDEVLLSHGSPRKPVWEYLVESTAALENFKAFDFQLALVGHTHLPLIFTLNSAEKVHMKVPVVGSPLSLEGHRLIVNPGSVGQPRDMNPEASYAILDLDKKQMYFRRVPYSVKETQRRMYDLDLPLRLIARLEMGR